MLSVKIEPAAHVERGHGDLIPLFLHVHLSPVVVVGRVLNPVLPEPKVASGTLVHLNERQRSKGLRPVVILDALGRASVGAHPPGHEHAELERAAGVGEPAEEVTTDDPGHEAGQKLAAVWGTLPLHQSHVRPTRHADLAVAPFPMADPLLGVVPVLPFIMEGVVFAVRIPATAAVLYHTDVPIVRQPSPLLDHRIGVVAVRRAH